jgi:hypothetical protein
VHKEYTILTSRSKMPSSMKYGSCDYYHCAIIEHIPNYSPKQISSHPKGVFRVLHDSGACYGGSTDRCQLSKAQSELHDLLPKYETRQLMLALAKKQGYIHVPEAQIYNLQIALRRQGTKLITIYSFDGKVKEGVAIPMPRDLQSRFGKYEHGKTREICRQEIAKKRQIIANEIRQKKNREIAEKEARRNEKRAKLFVRIANVAVSYKDIRAAGACDMGIKGWCASNNVNIDSLVPLSQLAKNAQAYPYALMAAKNILRNLRQVTA